MESLLQNINFLQLGLILGLACVVIYFSVRRLFKRKTFRTEDIIMSFAHGFKISICLNIALTVYFNVYTELKYMDKAFMIIGGFTIATLAVKGLRKSIVKKDYSENNN